MKRHTDEALITVRDPSLLGPRRPLLIAHRGGVLAPHAPENSRAAIRLAAEHRYDMVEIDVRESSDGLPVLYHDNTMERHTGLPGRVGDYRLAELMDITYLASEEKILSLAQALDICRDLKLGVMFDVKAPGDMFSDGFFNEINRLIDANDLQDSCVVINGDNRIQEGLRDRARIRILESEFDEIRRGAMPDLSGHFWFAMRKDLPDGMVSRMQQLGALVIPAMNTFRYPAHAFMEMARRDVIDCLELNVDGFQIDSVYTEFFTEGVRERHGYE
jgi:glycerophosphoryl diester phosphodiesterase